MSTITWSNDSILSLIASWPTMPAHKGAPITFAALLEITLPSDPEKTAAILKDLHKHDLIHIRYAHMPKKLIGEFERAVKKLAAAKTPSENFVAAFRKTAKNVADRQLVATPVRHKESWLENARLQLLSVLDPQLVPAH